MFNNLEGMLKIFKKKNNKEIKDELFAFIRCKNNDDFLKLVKEYDINTVNEDGASLLVISIVYENFIISKYLLNNGIDINIQGKSGWSALHAIANKQNISIAKQILKMGGNINLKDKHGNNALWTAAFFSKGKNYSIVKLFMEYGGNPYNKNKYGKSAMWLAKDMKDDKLIKILEGKAEKRCIK